MVNIEKKSSIFDSHKQFLYEEVGKRYYIDTQTFQLFYIKTEISSSLFKSEEKFCSIFRDSSNCSWSVSTIDYFFTNLSGKNIFSFRNGYFNSSYHFSFIFC